MKKALQGLTIENNDAIDLIIMNSKGENMCIGNRAAHELLVENFPAVRLWETNFKDKQYTYD